MRRPKGLKCRSKERECSPGWASHAQMWASAQECILGRSFFAVFFQSKCFDLITSPKSLTFLFNFKFLNLGLVRRLTSPPYHCAHEWTPWGYSWGCSFHPTVWATHSWASQDGAVPSEQSQADSQLGAASEIPGDVVPVPQSLRQEAAFLTLSRGQKIIEVTRGNLKTLCLLDSEGLGLS